MKRAAKVVFSILLFSTLLAIAQTPPQMPKPGQEQKKPCLFCRQLEAGRRY